jgi:hypothetical protein
MQITHMLKGELTKLFKNNDYSNKETGEVVNGRYQLQFLYEKVKDDGSSELAIQKISIPEDYYDYFKDKEKKQVQIELGVMVGNDKRSLMYYFDQKSEFNQSKLKDKTIINK